MRGVVHAFCDALSMRAPELFSAVIDDDIEWTVFGPVDLFPFFGHRQGREAVLAMLREIAPRVVLNGCDTERTLADGDHAASMLRVSVRDLQSHRTLSLRLALFAQFASGKLMIHLVLVVVAELSHRRRSD